jgi:hypothetical protein
MTNFSGGFLLAIVVLLACFAGLIVLQVRLAKQNSKWPGLILPALTTGVSLIAAFGLAAFSVSPAITEIVENGEVIRQYVDQPADIWSMLFQVGSVVFICNIPTVVFLAIYVAYRSRLKQQHALEKMSLQDL